MKKIFIFTVILIMLFSWSCNKQLELEPHKIYYDNFYQSEQDAISAINATYSLLTYVNQYNSYLWLIQDVGSDDCNARESLNDPNIHQFNDYNLQSTNTYLQGIWQGSYLGISRANIVLQKVPDIKMDSTKKTQILGEARFLRGLFYFNLVRLFGDVPLVLTPISSDLTDEEVYLKRTDKSLVYDQIIEDFTLAAQGCPKAYYQSTEKGRATKGAALGMLAKTQLTLKQWDQAASTCNQVMDLGVYDLWVDFTDNFKDARRNGKESVFAAQFYKGETSQNNQIVISGLPFVQGVFNAGVEIMLPTEDLLNSFEEGDYRKEATFFDHYWYDTFDPHIYKHWDQDAYDAEETAQCGSNFDVMRYSEVLLMYAEALNEASGPTSEAYTAINQVRARARNGNADVLPDLQGLSQDDFRTAVLHERRMEFVNEGIRWYDLVRTGKLIEYVKRAKGDKANPQTFNYVFPIPQRELDNNHNLTQNPNYQ
ncbi:MAG: RagB/SusD family nutrient uptake outer membrane protein [Bacteroidetes bacterium CG18_big_fil_WC_8_21_14_2_50_41_14]|nr:MAG: RagB/SusD family nutrient uptake outer membrane protein [Bacteroidetes bacterium CG18_big_fil_WC_8_21_14_2_50_41_14]PJB59466.1 MAG: RagB/SusD family nutrient uptake outer membrane protein [Bacteroidetes bacterium CG_4_9_14_3_um_filter_41_19]